MKLKLQIVKSSQTFSVKLVGSLAIVVIIIFLLVNVFFLGTNVIRSEWENYKRNQKDREALTNKKDILSNVSSKTFDKSETIAIAMPEDNPILWVMSQIKYYLAENPQVLIKSFAITTKDQSLSDINVSSLRIKVEATNISEVLSLVKYAQNILPITRVVSLSTQLTDLKVESEIEILIYWSEYPTKIANITEPVLSFTQEEIETVNLISKFRQPSFSVLSPSMPLIRENPFN